jgi:hypothetical protein
MLPTLWDVLRVTFLSKGEAWCCEQITKGIFLISAPRSVPHVPCLFLLATIGRRFLYDEDSGIQVSVLQQSLLTIHFFLIHILYCSFQARLEADRLRYDNRAALSCRSYADLVSYPLTSTCFKRKSTVIPYAIEPGVWPIISTVS